VAFLELIKQVGSAIGNYAKPICGKDPSGNVIIPQLLSNGEMRTLARDYIIGIAKGDIAGSSLFVVTANLAATGSGTKQLFAEFAYNEQSSGAQRSVVSTSANDAVGGTGAEQVYIEFVRGDGTHGSELIDMNGTTPVNTVDTNIQHINRFVVSKGELADGQISLMSDIAGGGVAITAIAADSNHNNIARYYTGNKTAFLTQLVASTADDGEIELWLTQTLNGQASFIKRDVIWITKTTPATIEAFYQVPPGGKIEVWYYPTTTGKFWGLYFGGWTE